MEQENVSTRPQVGGSHYSDFPVQPIDLIGSYHLDFFEGSVIKYVARANERGDRLNDLLKARHYLNILIARAQGDEDWVKAPAT